MQLTVPRSHRSRPSQAGFTFTEVLVALGVGMVAATAFLAFHRFQMFAMQDQARQLELQTTARNVVDLFAREARRTGMDPNCAKTFSAIADAKMDSVRLMSDLNGSGAIDAANEDLTYSIRNGYFFAYWLGTEQGRIERTASGNTDVLLGNVDLTGSRFRYFDANGNELVPSPSLSVAQRGAVRRLRIELALAADTVDPNKETRLRARAATDVDVRNRFFIASMACP